MAFLAPRLEAGLRGRIDRWARTRYTLLIRGEAGTGKTRLASEIHSISGRHGPFIKQSLAHIPDTLAESEFLGYRKGSYTGAQVSHAGLFEQAFKGTLFLDELHLATLRAQSILLGVVEASRVTRIQETRSSLLDVRLVLATNASLDELARTGAFRSDLLHRLGYFKVDLPALRHCRQDILPLAAYFLELEARSLDRAAPTLTEDVRRLFLRAPWHGNIREMRSVCEYLAVEAGAEARSRDLPAEFLATLGVSVDTVTQPLAVRAPHMVRECGGNISEAARRLRVSRGHLHRVLRAPRHQLIGDDDSSHVH